jgi:hypothetical protein
MSPLQKFMEDMAVRSPRVTALLSLVRPPVPIKATLPVARASAAIAEEKLPFSEVDEKFRRAAALGDKDAQAIMLSHAMAKWWLRDVKRKDGKDGYAHSLEVGMAQNHSKPEDVVIGLNHDVGEDAEDLGENAETRVRVLSEFFNVLGASLPLFRQVTPDIELLTRRKETPRFENAEKIRASGFSGAINARREDSRHNCSSDLRRGWDNGLTEEEKHKFIVREITKAYLDEVAANPDTPYSSVSDFIERNYADAPNLEYLRDLVKHEHHTKMQPERLVPVLAA